MSWCKLRCICGLWCNLQCPTAGARGRTHRDQLHFATVRCFGTPIFCFGVSPLPPFIFKSAKSTCNEVSCFSLSMCDLGTDFEVGPGSCFLPRAVLFHTACSRCVPLLPQLFFSFCCFYLNGGFVFVCLISYLILHIYGDPNMYFCVGADNYVNTMASFK